MSDRDQVTDAANRVTYYKQWPDTVGGDIDDNGTVRKMTAAETAELQRRLDAAAQQVKRANVEQAVASLRQWADDAEATTVTSANAVATLNVTLDRLAVFFNRFADLVESRQL